MKRVNDIYASITGMFQLTSDLNLKCTQKGP